MHFGNIPIIESEFLPPDFYVITNWEKPWIGAVPEWHQIYYFEGKFIGHPSVIRALRGAVTVTWPDNVVPREAAGRAAQDIHISVPQDKGLKLIH